MLRSLLAALVVAVAVSVARASIAPPPPPHEIAAKADVVFVGTVESVGEATMRVRVGEVLKGRPGDGVEVTVLPIHMPTCMPSPEPNPPWFAAGDRIVVAATSEKEGYALVGGALATPKLADGAALARAVAWHREMLRIVALDLEAQRAEFVKLMASPDETLADAARSFMYCELSSPEKSRAHVDALVAALDAPHPAGRYAAMYALRGHAPPAALERLLALTQSDVRDEAESACAVLGWYDDARAVAAIVSTSKREQLGHVVRHLGPSPREEAVARVRKLLRGDVAQRKLAFAAYQARFLAKRGTARDADDLLAAVRGGVDPTEVYDAAYPLRWDETLRVPKALVAIVRQGGSTSPQRTTASYALWWMANEGKRADVAALLRAEEALFVARIDEGTAVSEYAHILGLIHTDAAKAALERAKSNPKNEEFVRTVATWQIEQWDK